ncbi:YbaB/EbfC family nucleoid-associated protein [Planosporangium thailandense]|uniref:YbaB/EbfC family nucleoid-associated protein n=1 Tax=Planosporangium thailandense TaxID=765197 RepID=A0ABX0XUB6_9ACTN|nr:YbaB/EbfC family nucleoid-associated protein [Planosporangium thailandense]NJC68809.1 YbaB/EbfC family nucleoid-associated protein [Planosporangium thailandense]
MAMPFNAAGEDADAWVDTWAASVSARAQAARELSERVSMLSVSASSRDGAVEVTVAGSGVMTDLRLDERVRNWPADRIAAQVMAVMRRAQGSLAGRVAEIAEETVGADSETGRAVVDGFARRFPLPPDDGDDRDDRDGGDGRRHGDDHR